ncbi:MAG: tRNA lysidine(34) synthetase TilS [Bacteroidales bacterium]|nr:tRNA lysidine(34) synthetase TilS [Bacteroidales bacterium]
MLERFIAYIKKENLFNKEDRILLAVSGGADSVLMFHLFRTAGFDFEIAHCNFRLRGAESDEDENFVRDLAGKYAIPLHSISFNTKSYSKENKISIEMAARELRYNWFNELLISKSFKYVATAHNLNDLAETFFINILRGTGISGLRSILPKQNNIIRPVLFASKSEITAFLDKNHYSYREDSSNKSIIFLRNKIRHNIIPVFNEINPNFIESLAETIDKIRDTETVFRYFVDRKKEKIVSNRDKQTFISIKKLKKLNPGRLYLYEFLSAFNFNTSTVNQIYNSLNNLSGKQFYSPTHILIKDREQLVISEINRNKEEQNNFTITKGIEKIIFPIKLKFNLINKTDEFNIIKDKKVAQLDADKLNFPLTLRKWQQGDYFYPYGMDKMKKLSRFFIDNKLSLIDKQNIWVLCTGLQVIWVVGYRIDNRFRITDKTRNVLIVMNDE